MLGFRRLVAVLLTLAATCLATTAQSGSAHAADAPLPLAGPHLTVLTLHVTGCDRCSVTLQHAVSGRPHVWTSPTRRVGADHRVTFRLRTARTHGLSFVLRAPWQGNTGAVPNVVTRYAGHRVDAAVTRTAARHASRATGCWAGTTSSAATLTFRVGRVHARTLSGEPTYLPLAYATLTLPSWQPMVHAVKGTIGNQDAFYCTQP
jgi:hypothetical protein